MRLNHNTNPWLLLLTLPQNSLLIIRLELRLRNWDNHLLLLSVVKDGPLCANLAERMVNMLTTSTAIHHKKR